MNKSRDEMAVAIDFETFYDSKTEYSLTKLSPAQYVEHEKFDPYLIAISGHDIFDETKPRHPDTYYAVEKLIDGETEVQLYVGRPERFNSWDRLNGRILLAHNAGFDQVVFERCEELGRIPKLDGVEWNCTADLTAFLGVSRSLKDAMKYLFDKEISKAVRSSMDGRHDYDLNEQELTDLIRYGGDDAIECLSIWMVYCDRWAEIERAISRQNREAVMRGFKIDREYSEKALKCLTVLRDKAVIEIPWTTKINPKTKEFYPAGSLPALRNAVIELGVDPPKSFKKDDPGFLSWVKEHGDIPFVKARTRYAGTIQHIARIETLIKSADEDDIIHPGLIYFGAHTGRFSAGLSDESKGAKNVNMLNLPRANLFKGDPEVLDGAGIDMRGMYIPRPGYKFVIFDYSQIEARFSLWMARETGMLEAMKREGNLYQATSVHMGWSDPGDKIKKTDPDKYRLAKCCVLGLGYGMGAVKFVDNCKSQGLELPSTPRSEWPEIDKRLLFVIRNVAKIRDPFAPENESKVGQILYSIKVVDEWRSANSGIVSLWRTLADSFRARAIAEMDTVSFRLPSGRIKTYWKPRLVKELTTEIDENGVERPSYRIAMQATVVRGKPRTFLTGGNLLENIVQASCRDIMTYGAVEIERKCPSWKFCWSCYDEVIFEVPEQEVEEAMVVMPEIMCHGDLIKEWTEGLPLEVEGGFFDRYCK